MEKNLNTLKYRMYGFVPYNISDIQKGIQFGHAVVEYSNLYSQNANYQRWATMDKTFIILNGGTTNMKLSMPGTLNQLYLDCDDLFELTAPFHEPDLGDQLTAFVFLVDERVWDEEKYPDYETYCASENNDGRGFISYHISTFGENYDLLMKQREFLKDKKLA